jgi:hypothetical protein
VYYNQLTNSGTIGGTTHTPLALPVVSALPPFESATIGTQNITVNSNGQMTLAPGRYRTVFVDNRATLTLTGGTYEIKSLEIEENANLVFTAPTHVRISLGLQAEENSYVGPKQGTTIDASSIVFYVGGTDASSPFSKAVNIDTDTRIFANIYAKNGTLLMGDRTQATGAFLAKDITIGKKVQMSLATSFSGLAKGAVSNWTQQPNDVPESFSLSQNYPNPFNPTTQIRYGLPKQSSVKLTIHNVIGQEIARLVEGEQDAGFYEVQWNGRNGNGTPVASGIYFYRIQAGDFVKISKMVFLK